MLNAHERRERLIRILQLRGKTQISVLAGELEVSERTIMRDIETLSTSRPIYTLQGKHGGVCLVEGYTPPSPSLDDTELSLLRKILLECRLGGSVSLDEGEVRILSDIVAHHSQRKEAI